jgi:hypothetical protein
VGVGAAAAHQQGALLEDLADIVLIYKFAWERLVQQREARLAWERDGIDRRVSR